MIGKVGGVLPKMIATENDVAGKASGPDFASFIKEASIGLVIILFLIFEPNGLAYRWGQIRAWFKLYPYSY